MVICFFTPNPPSFFFVCVCLFYGHAVKTTQVYFSISGFNTWGLATLCSHQDRVAWLAAHCRSSSPCPCFVGRFKNFMWCDHGLKVGGKTHTRSVGLGLLLCRNYARPESASALFLCNVTGGHLLQGGPPLLLYSGSNLTTVDA